MIVEPAGRRTKHEELTEELLRLVATLGPGARLPSQTDLMRQFQVSDRTVLRSLEDLRRQGWIVRRRGSGTFVADRSQVGEGVSPRSAGEATTVAALALTLLPSPFYQRCLDVLAHIVEEAGWSLVCHHARQQPEGEHALPLEVLEPRGFVVFNFRLHSLACGLQQRGHRTVILGSPSVGTSPQVPCVHGDHDRGGFLAADHLLQLGHRRLAYVRMELGTEPVFLASRRWYGHQRAVEAARRRGLQVESVLLRAEEIVRWREDPALAAAYFRRPEAPTGIVVWNDGEAIRLLNILQHAGLSVPQDVSVVGYDALPEGAESLPPLTTVDQHLESQLRIVMDLLSREEPPPAQEVIVIPNLVVRGSSGLPPDRA